MSGPGAGVGGKFGMLIGKFGMLIRGIARGKTEGTGGVGAKEGRKSEVRGGLS